MSDATLGGKPVMCSGCKKPVQTDENGRWFCDCHDERVGIDPNHPDVVVIGEMEEDDQATS